MKIKIFLSTLLCLLCVSAISAQDGEQFIIKKDNKINSMSKNRLKEEIGALTRQAFNSTTSLEKTVGNVKINLSQKHLDFYQAENGKIASDVNKNDGILHVELAEIQSCFSDVISNLVENGKFFKKASRGDLREFLTLMQSLSDDLNRQVSGFNSLVNSIMGVNIVSTDKEKTLFGRIKHQFLSSAGELKKIQEKIQGSKCLKKT